nr:putative ribonuclease H-like domain-containing protein [Tanacetum cinerariifolium]
MKKLVAIINRFQPSGGYHVVPPPYTGTFMPPKLDLVFNTAPTAVETDHLAFNDWVSDSEDESKTKAPQFVPSFVQSSEQVKSTRHSVQPIGTSILAATPALASPKSTSSGKRRNKKACFVCKSVDHLIKDCDYHAKKMAQTTQRNYAHRGNHKRYASLTHKKPQKHMVPTAVLTQSNLIFNTAVRLVSAGVPKIMTSNSPPRVTAAQASVVSAAQGNISYLSDFEELNGGYVAFGGNPRVVRFLAKERLRQFCGMKGIKREFSVPRTPQQNGIAERKNKTLIEAAKTMLADSLLPIPFWAEAVNTACYVQNKVLLTKPHNKTPYELLHGKFEGKVYEGFLVGYSVNIKAFRVFNTRTRIVQETLHVNFLENKPNIAGSGPTWLFDINSLTWTMNYQPVNAGNQTNPSAGFQDKFDAEKAGEEVDQQYVLFAVWSSGSTNPQNNDEDAAFDGKEHDFDAKKPESEVNVSPSSSTQSRKQDDKTKKEAKGKSPVESFIGYKDLNAKFKDCSDNSSNEVNAAGSMVPTVGQNSLNSTNTFSAAELEDITYSDDEDVVGVEADFNNLESSIPVSPISTTRIHKDHPVSQIIGDLSLTTQTRSMTRVVKIKVDFHRYLMMTSILACLPAFFHRRNPKGHIKLSKMQKVWVLVDLPHGKRAIGHTQEEGIDYEEVFAPVVRIEAIRLFLAYASFMGFMVYQMDVKSVFLYGTIEEEVYVCQPPDNIIFGVTNKDLCKSFKKLMKDKFQMSSMGELTFFLGLQVKQKKDVIFISQDKYVAEILRKFRLIEGKSASTLIDTEKPLLKDLDVKRIFRYLKGKPHLGLWYLKDSPFDLVAYSDSDYAGATLDRKSTTGGCQFLGCRLISWQCKKQTVVATSSTEAEYVAVASCSMWNEVIEKVVTFTMSNPHKNSLVQKQTALGKDSSNPLMADNLLKIVWYSTHHVTFMKSWLVQKQMALGKDESNPLTVDSLLKTIWSSIDHHLTNEVLTIRGQTATGKEISNSFMAGSLPKTIMTTFIHSDASEGFNQVIDFLNGSYIKYALTVNPNIYVSCIKQFWNTVVIKLDNDVTRLQALVDKKKVVVTEAVIGEVLQLDDAQGVNCLPNEEIFAELARMGYEKPSTKLTFYKAFFSSQWKKGFSGVETPLFEGMIVGQMIEEGGDAEEHVHDVTDDDVAQGDDTATYGEVPTVYHTPPQSPQVQQPSSQPQPQQIADFPMSLLQEALDACANLTRRVKHSEYDKVAQALEIKKLKRMVKKLEKGNRGRIIDEMDKDDVVALIDDKEEDKKEKEAKVVENDQVQGRQAESQAEIYKIDMDHVLKVLSMQEDKPAEVQEVVDVVTTDKLITEVVPAASETVTATSTNISAAEPQAPAATIIAAPVRVAVAPSRRRKGVVIRDPAKESTTSSIIPADIKSKNKGKGIMVEEPKPLKKK